MTRLTRILLIGLMVLASGLPVSASEDSVSAGTYKELTEIQELMGAGDLKTAENRLKTLLDDVEEDTLDQALTFQTLGYALMAQEDFEAAIDYFKKSLALDRLPEKAVFSVGYMVAQLHAALGEFDEALTFAEEWFGKIESPKPDQYIFMANIYAQNERYAESAPYAEKAVSLAEKPKESWYQLLTANYFELERYPEAADALKRMVQRWPDNSAYWEQLASVYVVMENEQRALAVLKLAFDSGVLEKESTIRSMIQLAVMEGIPEHGGRLLQSALAEGLVPEEESYLEMLAQAWMNAREYEEAIVAYKRMAEVIGSGDPWMKIANVHIEDAKWEKAEAAVKQALNAELENRGKAWLLLGIAHSEQGEFEAGRDALRKAQAFDETERSATSWLRYAEDMKRQAEWLADNR